MPVLAEWKTFAGKTGDFRAWYAVSCVGDVGP